MKSCKICKEYKELSEFPKNGTSPSGAIKYKPECKLCHAANKKLEKIKLIDSIILDLGMDLECSICGYNKNRASLCFHHLESEDKDFSFSGTKMINKDLLKNEISKCVILCHNCHMELHYPHMNINASVA